MIIVRCTDGLGNQLFQYAIGRNLALKYKTSLFLDNNHFLNNHHRQFLLPFFKTKFSLVNNYKLFALRHPVNFLKLKLGFFSKINEEPGKLISDPVFSKNNFLAGYWASEDYFIDIRDILLEELQLHKKFQSKEFEDQKRMIAEEPNSVSIHVRRGDYTEAKNKSIFENLDLAYYQRSIEHILTKITDPTFYIFSDDIKWVKENLPLTDQECVFINESKKLKDYEELMLMSLCKHNITANSTFSWWAAWLNRSENKIVVQPKKWYKSSSYQKKYELNQTAYSKNFIRI